jgi:hypothetical protein
LQLTPAIMRRMSGFHRGALLLLLAAACGHAPPPPPDRCETVDGLETATAWTTAIYPDADVAKYSWFVDDVARRQLAELRVTASAWPQSDTHATDSEIATLSECAARYFAPPILRRTHDAKWEALADALEDWDRHLDHSTAIWPEYEVLEPLAHAYGGEESFTRLRGELRDRKPTEAEVAAGVLLTADRAMRQIGDRASPGAVAHEKYYYVADVPLTLAPLYALAAGADPKQARKAAQRCFEALGEAQHDTRLLVQPYQGEH